jgi:hypothetical protein
MSSFSTRSTSGGWLTDVITRNPEGLLLLAAGTALLMRKAATARPKEAEFQGNQRWERNGRHSNEGSGSGDEPRNVGDAIADAARSVGEYASEVSDKVRENATSYASSVADYADQASERTTRIARQARSTVQNSVQNVLQEQPLAVAVAGFAVGTALAAAFPPTEIEKRNLGSAGERLKEAAVKAGEQIKDAGVQAKEKLVSVAEDRGLTAEGLKEMAQEVGDAFSQALSDDQANLRHPPRSGSPTQQSRRTGQSSASGSEGQSRATGTVTPGSKRGSK